MKENKKQIFIKSIYKKMIVSCQAVENEALNNTNAITLVAKSVLEGGAEILRLSQYEHIKSIKTITDAPIIGLIKKRYHESEVVISPTIKEIDELASLKVDCIAIDATSRKRPKESLNEMVNYAKQKYPDICLMADCATLEEILNAEKIGFDLVGTTLRGYTKETKNKSNIENDFEFIKNLLQKIKIPLIAEGGFWFPEEVFKVLKLGAHSVVVGSAITRPKNITERFFTQLKKLKEIDNESRN